MHRNWPRLIHPNPPTPTLDQAIFVKVPMSYIFQHTLDGSLPKLVQWLDYISPATTIILEQVGHRYLCTLPGHQGLPGFCDLRSSGTETARLLHWGCFAPTLHPYSWRRMQTLVGVRELPVEDRKVILYATRSGGKSNNGGMRMVNNDEAVQKLLRTHFAKRGMGEEVIIYHANEYDPMQNLRLWNSARAVIGPHGGAMYNSFFCLPDTVVVEFVDLSTPNSIVVNHLVPHKASSFLQHKYWTIPQVTTRNFMIPLEDLQHILDTEFPLPQVVSNA